MTKLGTMVAVVLVAGLAGFASADATKEKEKPKEANGAITDVQLGEMLTNMGYEATKGTYKGGALYYDVQVPTKDYTLSVRITLSTNKRVVWLMCYVADLPRDVSAEKLRGLLQAVNSKTGKMQFRMTENALKADQPMDNFGVTAARLKRELEEMGTSLQDTASLWAPKKVEAKKEEIKKDEAKKDEVKK